MKSFSQHNIITIEEKIRLHMKDNPNVESIIEEMRLDESIPKGLLLALATPALIKLFFKFWSGVYNDIVNLINTKSIVRTNYISVKLATKAVIAGAVAGFVVVELQKMAEGKPDIDYEKVLREMDDINKYYTNRI